MEVAGGRRDFYPECTAQSLVEGLTRIAERNIHQSDFSTAEKSVPTFHLPKSLDTLAKVSASGLFVPSLTTFATAEKID